MDSSRGSSDEFKRSNKGRSKTNCMAKESLLKQSECSWKPPPVRSSSGFFCFYFLFFAESPAEFFAENKNIAGFDNVRSSSSSVL